MTASKQSSSVFFIREIGLSSSLDLYAAAGCSRDATQAQIEALLDHGTDPIAREVLASSVRRLAWHLLEQPPRALGAADHARALRDGAAQKATAAYLLAEAIEREAAGATGAECTELWEIADLLWNRLAQSANVAEELRDLATRLEMPEPDAIVETVLGAVTSELLPSLHLMFAAATPDAAHRAFHLRRMPCPLRRPLAKAAFAALLPPLYSTRSASAATSLEARHAG